MHSFTDNKGRVWEIDINIAAARRVKSLVGVNIVALYENKFERLAGLLSDPIAICDVIFAIVKPEADRQGVTDEQFGEAMAGDSIEQAAEAFYRAIVDFCPNPRMRKVMQGALGALSEFNQRVAARLDSFGFTPEQFAEQMVAQAIADLDRRMAASSIPSAVAPSA